jgi:hypothetical protein
MSTARQAREPERVHEVIARQLSAVSNAHQSRDVYPFDITMLT